MRINHRGLLCVIATVMVVMALGGLSLLWTMPLVAAQATDIASVAQQTGVPVAVQEGECSTIGAVVASFTNATVPSGSLVGNPDALPAATSFSTIPLSLDTLLASDHTIVVANPAEEGAIACGEIGGFLAQDGSLTVGLSGQQSSGVHGIAYLSPGTDGASTGVSLFIAVPGDLTQAAAPSEPTPVPDVEQAAAVAPINSGGLGLTEDEFHARYGTGKPDILGEVIEAGNGRIVFMATEEGKVKFIERYFNQGVSFEDARAVGMQLAPVDAVLLETYLTQVGSAVDLFYSASLADQFPANSDMWINGEPGQFIIGYGGYNPANGINEVTRIVMGLGNNP